MKPRGTGSVYRRGNVWWLKYYDRDGRVHRESSESEKRADAEKLLAKRRSEIASGRRRVGAELERTTFDDLERLIAEDYRVRQRKSLDSVLQSFRALRRVFEHTRVCDIQFDELSHYASERLRVCSPATVRRELVLLHRSMVLAQRAERLAQLPPFPTIAVDNARSGFFEDEDWSAIRKHLPAAVRDFGDFASLTGWRVMEVLRLRWAEVQEGVIRLPGRMTKSGRARSFPFENLPELNSLMERRRAATETAQRAAQRIIPWVFHNDEGEPLFGADGRPKKSFRRAWRGACKVAGLPARIPHDFRRTAVRNFERTGVPRSVAMELVGHKTESIYRRYDITAERELIEGVSRYAVGLDQRRAQLRAQNSEKPARWLR